MASSWAVLLLIPVAVSWAYWVATTAAMARFFRRRAHPPASTGTPAVSLVKPVCGPEKSLRDNLSTACRQDYPAYEVLFAVQDAGDPALPVLRQIVDAHPALTARIVVDGASPGPNGRLCNILNATARATGEVLVYSDSDMRLEPDYLRTIVAPLVDPGVGIACTVYRAEGADTLYERLELLSLNADFVPSMVFATQTGIALACPGASQAIRRETLEAIGGLGSMAHSFVEDLELGRRVVASGREVVVVPYVAATSVDLAGPAEWWRHQVYWNQNTRVASPVGFFFTWLVRGVPFACLYALAAGPAGAAVLGATLAVRLGTALVNSAVFLGDREGVRNVWLLPLHDVLGLLAWLASLVQRKVRWRGRTFRLKAGQMVETS